MTIRIVLADDHQLLRDALRALLEKEADIEVVGEAADGRAALKLVQALAPDVLVLDIGMSTLNGIEAAARVSSRFPEVKVVALSAHSDRRYVLEMIKAGAAAYVVKSAAGSELLRAVRAVMAGHKYFCPEVADAMASGVLGRSDLVPGGPPPLGRREREVVQLLAEGLRTAAIAVRMSISESTVEAHRRNIMRKLDLHTVADLTRYAIREGLAQL